MAEIASLNVRIGAQISDFEKKMRGVQQRMTDVGKRMQSVGKTLTTRLTAPLLGLAGVSAKVFDTQIQAEQQLAAALRATGQDVDALLPKMQQFAREIQAVTTVGDESTLKLLQVATNMGLTATQAERAAQNAIGLSKAMGINEQSAIRYTAALEQGNSTMLARYLPTIRSLEDDSARAAKAQELLAQMFDNARTEAENGLGPLRQLKNSLGDLLEQYGAIIVEALEPFIDTMKAVVARLQDASPQKKRLTVVIGGLVAALGPLVAILGTLSVLLGAINLPLVGIIALVAALAAGFTLLAANAKAVANTLAGVFLSAINFINTLLGNFLGLFETLANKLGIHLLDGLSDKFKQAFTREIPAHLKASEQEWKGFGEIFTDITGKLIAGVDDVKQSMQSMGASTATAFNGTLPQVDALNAKLRMTGQAIQQVALVDVPQLNTSLQQLSQPMQRLVNGVQSITGQIQGSLAGAFQEMADSGIKSAAQIGRAFSSMLKTIAAQIAAKAFLFAIFNLIAPGAVGVLTGGLTGLQYISGGLLGNTGTSLNVGQSTRIRGEDIYLVNQQQRQQSNRVY